MTLAFRPCGACGALVPADSGCDHWRVTRRSVTPEQRRARREASQARWRAEKRANRKVAP